MPSGDKDRLTMFQNRQDAGRQLAEALEKYRGGDLLVLAIPRGGAEVGYEVASYLDADFSIVISRKLALPDNPEAGFGAVAEDGSTFMFPEAITWLPLEAIGNIKKEQQKELKRRIKVLRKRKRLPSMKGKTVILVDDGIAMGSTIKASVKLCKNKKAGKIVVASPVAGKDVMDEIWEMADDVVILEVPMFFRAISSVYENWYDVTDEEVIEIMDKWEKRGKR